MKNLLLFLFFAIFCSATFGQAPDRLSREQAVTDIDTTVYYITAIHPDPFTIVSERDVMSEVERIKATLPDSITTLDLYLRLAPVVASLGDGHTMLFPNASVLRQLGGARYFPFELSVDPLTMEMTSGGRRITEINGMPAGDIVRSVVPTQSGESTAFRIDRVGNWPVMISVLNPAERYTVVFDGGETVEKAGVIYEHAVALSPPAKSRPKYFYHIIKDKNTAVLEFNECDDEETFTLVLEKMFSDMKEKSIDNLIIDIRANGGGNDRPGDELFQYISPVPFQQSSKERSRISEPLRIFFDDIFENEPEFEDIFFNSLFKGYSREDARRTYQRDTVLYSTAELIPLRENRLRFAEEGHKVFLLTSVHTFSSANNVASTFQYFDMGTIVGSETGGFRVSFGDQISFRLTYSQMLLGVSWCEFYDYGATDADRHPVYPDIAVPPAEALDYVLENLVQ